MGIRGALSEGNSFPPAAPPQAQAVSLPFPVVVAHSKDAQSRSLEGKLPFPSLSFNYVLEAALCAHIAEWTLCSPHCEV